MPGTKLLKLYYQEHEAGNEHGGPVGRFCHTLSCHKSTDDDKLKLVELLCTDLRQFAFFVWKIHAASISQAFFKLTNY